MGNDITGKGKKEDGERKWNGGRIKGKGERKTRKGARKKGKYGNEEMINKKENGVEEEKRRRGK